MKIIYSVLFSIMLFACSTTRSVQPSAEVLKPVRVKITTDLGVIIVRLYDSTPLHKENFIKLVNEHFFDNLLFHRVIPQFMIQGGDPLSKNATPGAILGNGGDELKRIPAEIRKTLFHKRGAMAGARDDNPEKASSACQFYIVQGKKFTPAELDKIELNSGIKLSPQVRDAYINIGGTPWLDNNYTVFGEVESGMDVVDRIAEVPKDANDRPIGDIHLFMELIKK